VQQEREKRVPEATFRHRHRNKPTGGNFPIQRPIHPGNPSPMNIH
jgi:hypothetical protein